MTDPDRNTESSDKRGAADGQAAPSHTTSADHAPGKRSKRRKGGGPGERGLEMALWVLGFALLGGMVFMAIQASN